MSLDADIKAPIANYHNSQIEKYADDFNRFPHDILSLSYIVKSHYFSHKQDKFQFKFSITTTIHIKSY